jgi:hypothetical protein
MGAAQRPGGKAECLNQRPGGNSGFLQAAANSALDILSLRGRGIVSLARRREGSFCCCQDGGEPKRRTEDCVARGTPRWLFCFGGYRALGLD